MSKVLSRSDLERNLLNILLSQGSSSEEGVYFQRSMLVSQIWSGLPRHVPAGAHASRQVLTFQGKSGSLFESFTTC
jgi:hypothetical protein